MSEPAPTPIEPAAPVTPLKPAPIGDYDDSMLSHLGLPFYYRHTPTMALSIVMGKMFAPVFSLHLFSATLLISGSVAGLLSGLALNDVCFAATVIILHAALMHALGAFLAIFTLAFRGFGAVFFLLLFGY